MKLRDLDQVVLGVPAAYDPDQDRLTFADHIPGWAHPQTLARLRASLRTELVIENDVKLAAVWERGHGAARGVSAFALLWAGTGLGLALDLGGSLYTGAGGAGRSATCGWGCARRAGPAAADLPRPDRGRGGRGPRPRARPAEGTRGRGCGGPGGPRPGHAVPRRAGTAAAGGLAPIVAVLDPPLVVLAGPTCAGGGEVLSSW